MIIHFENNIYKFIIIINLYDKKIIKINSIKLAFNRDSLQWERKNIIIRRLRKELENLTVSRNEE